MRQSPAKTVTPREVWAWAMYDFANSGYTTAVITAIFNAYFVAVVADNKPWATFAWTAALAVSYAAIMFTAPVIGAYTDAYAAKKKLLAANLAGICMGSSQSAGRALVGLLSPATRRAEFFGLWGLAVKLSSILGPLTYGLVTWISQGDHRLAILITGSYFVAGLAILAGVNVRRGRRAALRPAS